ncbi:Tim44-like domain-containing protein [Cryptosporidium ryanae]|uniref:Tim44-like domain-containing protein n=1 Tax=Cryptosporidium ryanae TaxID=515981 RepID=UPI00351A5923|nr:Tim44-like domain-containing protein [Cryptosporidium ryanae]
MLINTVNIIFGNKLQILLNNHFHVNKISNLSNKIYLFLPNKFGLSVRNISTRKYSYIKDIISQIKSDINEDKILINDLNSFINNGLNIHNKFFNNKRIVRIFTITNSQKSNFKLLGNFYSHHLGHLKRYSYVYSYFINYLKLIKNFFEDKTEQNEITEKLINWKNNKSKSEIFHIKYKINNHEYPNNHKYEFNEVGGKINEKFNIDKSSIIVQEDSVWDRFGAKLKDMPILKDFFENPIIGRIFRESEISSAIKQMKILDPKFKLFHLISMVENVVIPHYLNIYLSGNEHELKLHTADVAFKTLLSNVNELKSLGLNLDPTILFIGELELKGVKISKFEFTNGLSNFNNEKVQPIFIFTFTVQQINCLRNLDGEIVSGSKDDIREVLYSIAVTHHPNNETPGLKYPFLVTELAILGMSPIL